MTTAGGADFEAAEFKEGAGPGALWAGVLAAPLAALWQQSICYALVHWACGAGRDWPLHLVSFAALCVTLAAGLLSLRNWRRAGAGAEGEAELAVEEGAGVRPRSRFMALVGLLLSALSALVVVAQWIAVFVYTPCQR